ncbi:MAG: hypothetical protein KDK70_22155 [Myxococcales bacterium]|nr:hypothetical protein [Myxococcales bacterium]
MTPHVVTHSIPSTSAAIGRAARGRSTRRALLGLALLTSAWAAPAHAYPTGFPSRGDALPSGVLFRTSGHGASYGSSWAIDFKAYDFDGTQWREFSDGVGATNESSYAWGTNVYAPEDGEIVACWRTTPDKPDPNTDYDIDGDGITGEVPDDVSPIRSGNHLQIRTADGDYLILLAHLQYDSIPPSLCPLGATGDWPADTSEDCSLPSPWEGFPASTILPTPVPIRAGDFLGRIGHSGSSGAPHLHMHVKPFDLDAQGDMCVSNSVEIEFYEAWAQPCSTYQNVSWSAWDPLDVENPLQPGSTSTQCFLPDAIGAQQDHEDLGVPATNLHMTTDPAGDVMAYQSGGALRLRSYDLAGSGSIVDQDTLDEGTVLDLALARPSNARDVVVSVRGSNGKLKHIPYAVDGATCNPPPPRPVRCPAPAEPKAPPSDAAQVPPSSVAGGGGHMSASPASCQRSSPLPLGWHT